MICSNCKLQIPEGLTLCPNCKTENKTQEILTTSTPSSNIINSQTTQPETNSNIFSKYWDKIISLDQKLASTNTTIFKYYKIVRVILFAIIVISIIVGFIFSKESENYSTDTSTNQQTNESITRDSVNAYGDKPVAGVDYEKGTIIFGLKYTNLDISNEEIDINTVANIPRGVLEILKKYDAKTISRPFGNQKNTIYNFEKIYVVKIPEDKNVLHLMTELQKYDYEISFAEPSYYVKTNSDPFLSSNGSWGQSYDDLWNIKIIEAPKAWELSKGAGVTVGVIDTGVDHTHPDLEGNVVNNFPGDCSETHGTHVAGIIAGRENGIGIVGVAPQAKINPFSIRECKKIPPDKLYEFQKSKDGENNIVLNYGLHLVQSVLFSSLVLKSSGSEIVNMSMNTNFDSFLVNSAVNNLIQNGTVVVNSAGNESEDVASHTPANNPQAIVVTATDQNDGFSSYSNFGKTVTVAAPGGDASFNILSAGSSQVDLSTKTNGKGIKLNVGDKYVRLSGTSMAAPHVTGLAALVKSLHPDWNNKKIKCAIILGADDKGDPGWDPKYGYGRINAYKTLSLNPEFVTEDCIPVAEIDTPVSNSGINNNQGTIKIKGTALAKDINSFKLEYLDNQQSSADSWKEIVKTENKIVNKNILGEWNIKNFTEGYYQLRLTVEDKDKNISTDEVNVYIFNKPFEDVFDMWFDKNQTTLDRDVTKGYLVNYINNGKIVGFVKAKSPGAKIKSLAYTFEDCRFYSCDDGFIYHNILTELQDQNPVQFTIKITPEIFPTPTYGLSIEKIRFKIEDDQGNFYEPKYFDNSGADPYFAKNKFNIYIGGTQGNKIFDLKRCGPEETIIEKSPTHIKCEKDWVTQRPNGT